ncbi:conserved hypothetical protein [Trichinella spiralis]|uniref:hypothetical protein n=1 Tax=Trichinella spiralis TaxID=6334 RepID=UPI0001EFDDD6|nr:conserved hypothetical protein [Trichinella spiralis]
MNMGGIDLKNMLAALYRIEHKSRKWTRRIFFWIISTAMTDAWHLYRRDRKEMPGTCTGTKDLLSFTCQKPSRVSSSTPPLTSTRLGRRPTDVSREVAKDETSQ